MDCHKFVDSTANICFSAGVSKLIQVPRVAALLLPLLLDSSIMA